jgi:Domain of unknown function (DUF4157)
MLQFSSEVQQEGRRRPASARAAPSLQRKCACGGTSGPTGECEECRKKRVAGMQRRLAADAQTSTLDSRPLTAPPVVHEVLRAPGEPLPRASRAALESRFRFDFSHVQVHTDAKAADSARAVDALAYTVGRDVVFGAGQYRPGTVAGESLLAHELAHVVQQHGTTVEPGQAVPLAPVDDHFEREAEAAGADNGRVSQRSASGLQRQPAPQDATPSGKANECDGWEKDPVSFSIHVANHVARTFIDPSLNVAPSQGGKSVTCKDARHCDVSISNGQVFRVAWEPSTRIALVRFDDNAGESIRYIFNYSCPAGQLKLDFKERMHGDTIVRPPATPPSSSNKPWYRKIWDTVTGQP